MPTIFLIIWKLNMVTKFFIYQNKNFYWFLTQSMNYQTSKDHLSKVDFQIRISPYVPFPKEPKRRINYIYVSTMVKNFFHILNIWRKLPMCGLQIMPRCPCQKDPCDKRRPSNAVHLPWKIISRESNLFNIC